MADAARNITIKVLLDEAKARMGLKSMGDDAEKTGTRWQKMGAAAKAGVALAGVAVVKFLGDATKNAIADEAAQRQLALAVTNSTGATEDQVSAVEDYIDKTSRATGITDDELRPAFANLARATGDVTQAQDLMATAMDIATARGLPLEAVTLAIGKAAQGNIGALGRMGLATRDAAGKYLDFEEAIDKANETMGGATAVAAESAEGQMKRLSIAVDEAKEDIGSALIPVFEAAIPVIMDLSKAIGIAATEFGQWTGNVSDIDAAIKDFELHMGESADTAEAALTVWKSGGIEFGELLKQLKLGGPELLKLKNATDEFLKSQGFSNEMIVQYRENVEKAIAASVPARGEAELARISQQRLGDEYATTTGLIYDQITADKELTDPLFALITANDRVATAQGQYNAAVATGTENSPAAQDAALDLAKAHQDAEIAAARFAEEGGQQSIDKFIALAREAGLSQRAIDLVIDSIRRANQTPFNPRRAGELEDATGHQPGRQHGGPVTRGTPYTVGERGPETFVPNASGRIHPNGRGGGGGTTVIMNNTINAGMGSDPNAISRAIVEMLQRYERANGALPVRTRH